ncbi:MAG: hypothetical protein ACREBZ_00390 [Thermoplasmata archaeon]
MKCPSCGLSVVPIQPPSKAPGEYPSPPDDPPPRFTGVCPNCKTAMTRSGELEFRVGGYTGGSGLLLGQWNQLAEQKQPFSVYHCPQCGRVDLYEPGR